MLLGLALTGFLVALLPLYLALKSGTPDKYRKLAWVTTWLTFDLILFGAFTRLTDSGLGCPDWPGCYNRANPFLSHQDITTAQALQPFGPVTIFKAWVEMIHRYIAMALGFLIIFLLIQAWRSWRKTPVPRFTLGLPLFLLFFICIQGAFGAFTVTQKLQPIFVTLHLLSGMGLLGLLAWLAVRQNPPISIARANIKLRSMAAIGFAILFTQLALGGWVSSNYAALACTSFPRCQGSWWPTMDFGHGFTLWRALGKTGTGDYLPFSALTAIHEVHRFFAFVVFAWLGFLAWRLRSHTGVTLQARALLFLLCLQLVTGLATIFLNWPLPLAVMHTGGSALMVLCLTIINVRLAQTDPYSSLAR